MQPSFPIHAIPKAESIRYKGLRVKNAKEGFNLVSKDQRKSVPM